MDDRIDQILSEERPWGGFVRYALNETCTVKVIEVRAQGVLSSQRHRNRDELWVALDAGLEFEIGTNRYEATVGQPYFVPRETIHRVRAVANNARFLEVAFGHFQEDDIERLDDAYGRV